MRILGISAFYHDSAAALVVDGDIVAAAQEERFTRIKHDSSFPQNAVRACLDIGGITLDDVDYIAFYDKPFLKFERLLETYLSFAPHGFGPFQKALPVWLKEKLFLKDMLIKKLKKAGGGKKIGERLLFAEHHFSHAASAFFPSPFEEAVVLTIDGVGEWATTTAAIGRGNKLSIEKELHFPHSLGLLYSAFTYYTGFKVNSGEYKVMGLAPYGEPKFRDIILDRIVDLKEDGTFHLDQSYFDYCTGLRMTNEKFAALFGQPPRKPETELLTQFHMDVAASIQAVTEEVMLRLTRSLAREYGVPNLCLAGGVALNCVANGKILRDQSFRNMWIQPAAGDAGGAVGAALATWHTEFDKPRNDYRDRMRGALLGPSFSDEEIAQRLTAVGARFDTLSRELLLKRTAEALSVGKAVGWFQGRMEFGPRALGARSIIADPRSPTMQKNLNLKVKFRKVVPPLRAGGVARRRGAMVRARHRQPLHVAGRQCARGPPARYDERRAAPVRHRQAQRGPLRHSRRHPCGLFGARADRRPRDQRAVLRSAHRLQKAHRLRRPGQYLIQRPRRADRVHAGRRLPLFSGHGARCLCLWQHLYGKDVARPGVAGRLQE